MIRFSPQQRHDPLLRHAVDLADAVERWHAIACEAAERRQDEHLRRFDEARQADLLSAFTVQQPRRM